ncbi:MAG: hypothetical protein A2Z21_00740 [Candidatus Fraserbacteria bacterium RBG_16_55_9]|uniref:HicB-like antitoxin of toxin-antitoxin system domain-containing protein n=1 Tax=Fraserbacteria sp. (strain RBG_16_55_9) TaxID=1817864 RepID=A0A1F5UXL9_FRAXR|nr:MAG: hypothetical protein A2Z21_00740 [Candidatus Fraserbacteria bacterium RBG_16_55_9]
MEYTYTVIYQLTEEGGTSAYVPALGVNTQGGSLEEARSMAKDLIQDQVETFVKTGKVVPQETERYEGEKVSVKVTVTVT